MAEPERDARLERIEHKLDKLTDTVTKIAVQDQRLNTLEKETGLLFGKLDACSARVTQAEQFQASCPRHGYRGQITTIWVFISAIILAVIGAFIRGS